MKKIDNAIKHFMNDMTVYDNPFDVEIMLNEDNSVVVAAIWPGEDNDGFNLEFFYESNTIAEFAQAFGIKSPEYLIHITPAFLMNLYQQGKASVFCAVDNIIGSSNYYPLYFRKQGHSMWAANDYGVEHEVPVVLETPQQFINYTRECYQLSNIL